MTLEARLFDEILRARERVYAVGGVTPLERLVGRGGGFETWVKREDLGPIKAYKWRGAFNAMAALDAGQLARGVVAASAGNHAQGVALAARQLGCGAVIFMPRSTPEMKQREVRRHGASAVDIRLVGDSYDEAAAAAREFAAGSGGVFIHPYDDLLVMGGQGTLADEVVMSGKGPFDRVYVPIGGGGMIAATACWLKRYWPGIKVIGVEGVDQASMQAALAAGGPVTLDYVDVFCDGTAVRRVGELTYALCRGLVDEYRTVSNDEVCGAIRELWEANRSIPEPSGAMGLAAVLQDAAAGRIGPGERVLTILCGANMDFAQFGVIARRAGIGAHTRRDYRIPIPEGRGTLVDILRAIPPAMSIHDLQYGRTDSPVQHPVIGLLGTADDFARLDAVLAERGVVAEDVSAAEDVGYRIIPFDPGLFENPLFVQLEFPERAGAFLQFMEGVRELASLCYFNYAYSGERVGRALVGMDFATPGEREACRERVGQLVGDGLRAVRPLGAAAFARLTGAS